MARDLVTEQNQGIVTAACGTSDSSPILGRHCTILMRSWPLTVLKTVGAGALGDTFGSRHMALIKFLLRH